MARSIASHTSHVEIGELVAPRAISRQYLINYVWQRRKNKRRRDGELHGVRAYIRAPERLVKERCKFVHLMVLLGLVKSVLFIF